MLEKMRAPHNCDFWMISHFWCSSRVYRKYIPQETPLGNWKALSRMEKSLWKAISISPTSLHRILTSCQNWKQSFILHQWKEGNILWEQDKVFPARLFLFIEKMVVTSPPLRKNKCSYEYIVLQCLYKTSINFLKSIYIVYY